MKINRRQFLGGLAGLALAGCPTIPANPPDRPERKAVLFMMADLQYGWLEAEAEKLTNIHIRNNLPVTLAVISGQLWREDGIPGSLAENLKKWYSENGDSVEIASHTFAHDDYSTWSLSEQIVDMKNSRYALENLGIYPVTLAPAMSWGNEETPRAIKRAGFNIGMNSAKNYLENLDKPENAMILHDGIEFGNNFRGFNFNQWDASAVADVIYEDPKPYTVIGYHQQDFNQAPQSRFDEFEKFLNRLRDENNFSFLTAEQYYHRNN